MLLFEAAEHGVRVEADGVGIRPDERAAEDAARPPGDVVGFQPLEQGERDFGGLGNGLERQPTALAFGPEIRSQRGDIVHQLKELVVRRVLGEYALLSGRLQADPSVYSGPVRPPAAASGLVAGMALILVATAGVPARPRSAVAPISQMTDSLTADVAAIVKGFRGQMGVAAINLRTGATVEIGADLRFPTASTIKTAVMVEAWQQAADGRLTMEAAVSARSTAQGRRRRRPAQPARRAARSASRDLVHLMIVLSDNTATNMLIEKVGTARVNAGLERHGLHEIKLFRPTFRDGRPDVLPELEREYGLGMTTPRDMARLMALIAEGKAVNKAASEAMLATLRRQQDRAMIPREIDGDGIQIGNKTGTDEEKQAGADGRKRHVRGDAAIVTGPNLSYVIAIHARQVEDMRWGIDNDALVTGARISKTIFDAFSRRAEK